MTKEELAEFRQQTFHPSRFPKLDAISTFVPTGQENDPIVRAALEAKGFSRWTPVHGGHDLLILHEGEPFDATRFELKRGAWDHEHCKACRATIPSLTLCWLSESGPYAILCEQCYRQVRTV